MSGRFTSEFRSRAVRMVRDHGPEYGSVTETITRVSGQLGCSRESLRRWVVQAGVDAGTRPGVTSEESVEVKRLKKEVRELRQANEILRAAAVFFAGELGPRNTG